MQYLGSDFPSGSVVKSPPAMQGMWVQSLGWEEPLEKEMATNFSILAWEIPGQRSLAGYSPWGLKIIRNDLVTKQKPPYLVFTNSSSSGTQGWTLPQ